jgi:hypothetical protein
MTDVIPLPKQRDRLRFRCGFHRDHEEQLLDTRVSNKVRPKRDIAFRQQSLNVICVRHMKGNMLGASLNISHVKSRPTVTCDQVNLHAVVREPGTRKAEIGSLHQTKLHYITVESRAVISDDELREKYVGSASIGSGSGILPPLQTMS